MVKRPPDNEEILWEDERYILTREPIKDYTLCLYVYDSKQDGWEPFSTVVGAPANFIKVLLLALNN